MHADMLTTVLAAMLASLATMLPTCLRSPTSFYSSSALAHSSRTCPPSSVHARAASGCKAYLRSCAPPQRILAACSGSTSFR